MVIDILMVPGGENDEATRRKRWVRLVRLRGAARRRSLKSRIRRALQ